VSKGGQKSIDQEDTVGGRNLQTMDTKTEETLPHPPSPRKQASTSNMKNMSINIKTTAISTTASDTAK